MDSQPTEQAALEALAARFMTAMNLKNEGDLDRAEEVLREIIRSEPRLAEPHMELARILLDTERVEDAEPHAREALTHLDAGGPWTAEIPPNVVSSVGHALLAEILRQRAESDAVLFGDPEVFKALIAESRTHFEEAASLDPTDATSSYYAFFMGPKSGEQPAPAPKLAWNQEPGEA